MWLGDSTMTRINWENRINNSDDEEWKKAMLDVLSEWSDDGDFLIGLATVAVQKNPEAFADVPEGHVKFFNHERTQLQTSMSQVAAGCDDALEHCADPMSREIIRKVLAVLNKADYMLDMAITSEPKGPTPKHWSEVPPSQHGRRAKAIKEARGEIE